VFPSTTFLADGTAGPMPTLRLRDMGAEAGLRMNAVLGRASMPPNNRMQQTRSAQASNRGPRC